jgi:hypothetical protein
LSSCRKDHTPFSRKLKGKSKKTGLIFLFGSVLEEIPQTDLHPPAGLFASHSHPDRLNLFKKLKIPA